MPTTIYVFSGLGADERAFQKLDFAGADVCFIRWISPRANESLPAYAKRLLPQVESPSPILLGLSFGGMLAQEVAKLIPVQRIILLASAKSEKEIPPYFRLLGTLGLHRLLPSRWIKKPSKLNYWLFGAETAEDRHLLDQILQDTDASFLHWALPAIAQWKNTTAADNLIHIHGSRDRILPIRFVAYDLCLEGAGHFMTLNRPQEISELMRPYLA